MVTASGPKFGEKKLKVLYDPEINYRPDIECSPDNVGMIGIVATEDGKDANYWTVCDAF